VINEPRAGRLIVPVADYDEYSRPGWSLTLWLRSTPFKRAAFTANAAISADGVPFAYSVPLIMRLGYYRNPSVTSAISDDVREVFLTRKVSSYS